MPAPTGTAYPSSIDTSTSIGTAVSSGQVIQSVYADTSSSAIIAIEGALGTNPQGSDANVGAALTARARKTDVQNQALTYAADSGTVNAYAIAVSPTPPTYTAGQMFSFLTTNANSGPSTLAVNGQAAQPLVHAGGAALEVGDIQSGQMVSAIYDGTQFQMVGGSQVTPAAIQNESYTFAGDTGSANAYAVALTPTPDAYTAGQVVVFVAANANTGASTLSINGATAQNLVANGGTAFTGGEIVAGQIVAAVFDGTQFQLVGASGGGGSIPATLPANTISELRLTLQTGTPIVPDSGVYGTTIYFTPYTGGRIALYDIGSSSWQLWTTPELSLDITGYDTSYPWDMFLYNDSGTLTLTALEWSGGDTRATDIVLQDGVYVQNGAPNYRWLGSFYVNPGDGNIYDNLNNRCLFNAQNRVPRCFSSSGEGAYSTNSNAWSDVASPTVLIGIIQESIMMIGSALGQGDGVSTACDIGVGFYSSPDEPSSIAGTIGTSFIVANMTEVPPDIGLLNPTLFFCSSINGNTVNLLEDGSGTFLTFLNGTYWG